jgi:hypothetical protein
MYVYSKGRKAKQRTMKESKINEYLRSGQVQLGDQQVNIIIENKVVEVKNKREARKKIDENDGYGVIVENNSRKFGRAYHTKQKGYDFIQLTRKYGNERVLSHEAGHDFGFSDKYIDVEGYGSLPTTPFTDGLMGGVQPLNDYELSIIANDVLHENSLENTGGYPVDRSLDNPLIGTKAEVVPWDYRNNKPTGDSFNVKVTDNWGTARGKKTEENNTP